MLGRNQEFKLLEQLSEDIDRRLLLSFEDLQFIRIDELQQKIFLHQERKFGQVNIGSLSTPRKLTRSTTGLKRYKPSPSRRRGFKYPRSDLESRGKERLSEAPPRTPKRNNNLESSNPAMPVPLEPVPLDARGEAANVVEKTEAEKDEELDELLNKYGSCNLSKTLLHIPPTKDNENTSHSITKLRDFHRRQSPFRPLFKYAFGKTLPIRSIDIRTLWHIH